MARRQAVIHTGASVVRDVQEEMTLREVARYAEVRPSAVSNWKRRHADFPSPVEVTSSGTLYSTAEIIDWLERHGKLDSQTHDPEEHETWNEIASMSISQMLRETSTEEVRKIVLSLLLHAAISRGPLLRWRSRDAQQRMIPITVDQDASAPHLIERFGESEEGEGFIVALREAWQRCEEKNRDLRGLLMRASPEDVQPGLVMFLLQAFDAVAVEGQSHDLDPLHRVLWDEIAPFESRERGEATPIGLSRLLVGLTNGRGPGVLDLAAGTGSLAFDFIVERWRPEGYVDVDEMDVGESVIPDPDLVEAVEAHLARNIETDAELVDPNVEALTEARIWSLIYDVPVTITQDRLRPGLTVQGRVDSLVVDAPAGVRQMTDEANSDDWLDAHAAGDLEVGFLVAARQLLATHGRAAIAVSTRVATGRSTRLIEARGDLINSGHVEAVIALPGNLHEGRSRPMSIIVMVGAPRTGPLLLIDATACGIKRRRNRELSEIDTAAIVELVMDWRAGHAIAAHESIRAVTVEPVDLDDNVLDAALYLPLPDLPDAVETRADVDRLRQELRDVTAELSSMLNDLFEDQR